VTETLPRTPVGTVNPPSSFGGVRVGLLYNA
jgi:hypothetical protein